jgi:hypothetical protein
MYPFYIEDINIFTRVVVLLEVYHPEFELAPRDSRERRESQGGNSEGVTSSRIEHDYDSEFYS